jgi:Flp pilus assembly protein TadG
MDTGSTPTPMSAARPGARSARRRRRAGQRGIELVEFSLIAPVLLLLVMGLIEFGVIFNSHIELRSAAREGGRLAVVDNGCANGQCPSVDGETQLSNLITATRAKAKGVANVNNVKITVSCSNASGCTSSTVGTDTVTVCLNYQVQSVTMLLAPVVNNVELRASATKRLEQVPTFNAGSDSNGTATCP